MVKEINDTNISPLGHLEEDGHQIASAKLVFPGARGKLKRTIQTADGTVLKSGTTVIIQPINRNKENVIQEFKLTPFHRDASKERSDQPESQRDIITEASHDVEFENPSDFLNFNDEHFRRTEEVLFPTPDSPSLDEIAQGRIPDCFYLAAIQTILNHPNGKAFIRGMMRQNSDGTTTVRLYNPETLQPEYFRIENSVIIDGFGELNFHNALWVHILEKAFAARARKNGQQVDASVSSVYSGGGHINDAVTALTGVQVVYKKPKANKSPEKIQVFLEEDSMYDIITSLIDANVPIDQVVNGLTMLRPTQLEAIYNLFGLAADASQDEKNNALISYCELIKCYKANPAQYNEAFVIKSAHNLQQANPVAANLIAGILKRAQVFSGHYSTHQEKVFTEIKNGLAKHSLMTASTPKAYDKKPIGLCANHAYTILGVVELPVKVKDETGNVKTIMAKFVKIRNPWGKLEGLMDAARQFATGGVGRSYKQNSKTLEIKAFGVNNPRSLVELSEFCRYFDDFTISNSVEDLFKRDAEKEKCLVEINQFANEHNIDFTSSNLDLVMANEKHDQLIKNLLNVELMELGALKAEDKAGIHAIFNQGYDSDVEEKAVMGLIDENVFPRIAGNADAIKRHVYSLLKLDWLQSQNQNNQEFQNQLIEIIRQNATQKTAWESLRQIKLVISVVFMSRTNAEHNIIAEMHELAEQINKQMEQFLHLCDKNTVTCSQMIDTALLQLINNVAVLEKLFYRQFNLDLVAKKFNCPTYDAASMEELSNTIHKCKELFEPVLFVKPEFKKLWNLIKDIQKSAVSLEAKHVLSGQELQQVATTTRCVFSGGLQRVGDQLLQSTQPEKRELGRKMVEADGIAKKIQHAMNSIALFFTRVATTVSTLFHFKNAYELPSVPGPARQLR